MRTIDFDSTEIYPLDASSPKEIHKVWIDPEVWETNIAGGEYIIFRLASPRPHFKRIYLKVFTRHIDVEMEFIDLLHGNNSKKTLWLLL